MSEKPLTEITTIESFCAFNSEVFKVYLRLPENSAFNFTAGQYLHLVLDKEDKRPFSIASAPEALPNIELHIRQMLDNEFTEEVIRKLRQSNSIKIEGPFGCSVISKPVQRPLCFIVGGTGFSPAKAMIENLFAEATNTDIHLFWGARTADELYFNELPQKWQQQNPSFSYTPVIFEEDSNWSGDRGLVHKVAVERMCETLKNHEIYIAGSLEMVLAVYKDLLAEGVAKTQIHADMLDILRERGELD